jgi:hypothetical protein
MKVDPHIWADGRTARKIDHRCTQKHVNSITYLRASVVEKSCFVGYQRLYGGSEPPFSSVAEVSSRWPVRHTRAENTVKESIVKPMS